MNKNAKNFTLLLVITLMVYFLFILSNSGKERKDEVSYSQFINLVEGGKIYTEAESPLTIQTNKIEGKFNNEMGETREFFTYIAYPDEGLIKLLRDNNIIFK